MRIKLGMTKRRSMELKRMEEAGLIASYEGTVVEKMTKTYYRMEPSGKEELSAWLFEPLGQMPSLGTSFP